MANRNLRLTLVFLLCTLSNAWYVAYDSRLRKCACTANIRIHVKRKTRLSVQALRRGVYERWKRSGKTSSLIRTQHVFAPGLYEVKHRIHNSKAWAIVVLATNHVSVTAKITSQRWRVSRRRPPVKFRKHRTRTCRLRLSFSTPVLPVSVRPEGTAPFAQYREHALPIAERIINGALARGRTAKQSTYTVMLRYKTYLCTGSVISPNWILSAAHCHHGYGSKVYLSRHKKSRGQRRMVTRVYRHPDYVSGKYASHNDIALLKIDRPLFVTPLKLYNGTTSALTKRFARETGFGRFSRTKRTDMRLRVSDTPIISIRTCRKRIRAIGRAGSAANLDNFGHICTDSRYCGVSSCSGDSGGPLCVRGRSREHVQVGILSFTLKRCAASPDISTNVAHHYSWISSIAGDEVQFTNKLFEAGQ